MRYICILQIKNTETQYHFQYLDSAQLFAKIRLEENPKVRVKIYELQSVLVEDHKGKEYV